MFSWRNCLSGHILDSAARAATENGLRLIGTLSKPFPRAELLALLAADAQQPPPIRTPADTASPRPVSVEQLAGALKIEAFIAYFQPKISWSNGELVGFECLARWPQHDGGMIAPDQFIGLAEQSGLIDELTRQIYQYALANLPARASDARLKFALNLSPLNLNDETFPRWLQDKCQEYHVEPSQIILEPGELDAPEPEGERDPVATQDIILRSRELRQALSKLQEYEAR